MPDKLFCSAPFRSIRLDSQQGSAAFRPCCAYQNQSHTPEILENYLSSPELRQLQNHFRDNNGEWPVGCQKCKIQEDSGQESLRDYYNRKFLPTDTKYTRLEVLPSNICNLKCFMCDQEHSTAVAAEQHKLGWIAKSHNIDLEEHCQQTLQDLPDVDTVSFIGGEFFLAKQNLEILDVVIQRGLNVELTTNASIILPEQLEKLKQIKTLELQISIDGLGSAYNFMRYPAQWEQIESNINLLQAQLPQAKFLVIFVVQPLNLQHMLPTIDYFNRRLFAMNLHDLVRPEWLSWQILTHKEANDLGEFLHAQCHGTAITKYQTMRVENLKNMLANVQPDPALREQFISRMKALIQLRGISKDTVAQHFGILQELANAVS